MRAEALRSVRRRAGSLAWPRSEARRAERAKLTLGWWGGRRARHFDGDVAQQALAMHAHDLLDLVALALALEAELEPHAVAAGLLAQPRDLGGERHPAKQR